MKIKHDKLEQYDLVISDYIDKAEDRYAPWIGLFLIRFSELEHTLDTTIADFLMDRSHEMGYLVIAGTSLNNKIELFRKLFHLHTKYMRPQKLARLKRLVKRLHDLRVFRNYVAHANWSTLEKTGYVRTRIDEKDGEVILKKVRMTPDKINSWVGRIEVADEDLYDFAENMTEDV